VTDKDWQLGRDQCHDDERIAAPATIKTAEKLDATDKGPHQLGIWNPDARESACSPNIEEEELLNPLRDAHNRAEE